MRIYKHVASALLILVLDGCRESRVADVVPGVSSGRIKVGTYGPLSGPAAPWGVMLHAMSAYFDHVNAEGGIHGRRVELVIRDDQYSAEKTPEVVRDLVEQEGVFALLAGIGTANGRAVSDYLQARRVPFFSPASGDAFFTTGDRDHIYTVYPRYETEGAILGRYLTAELGLTRVAVLFQEGFGAQGKAGLERALENFGARLVVEVSCLASDTDLTEHASRIARHSPEALVIFTSPRPAVRAVTALHGLNQKPQVVTSFILSDPVLMELATPEVWEGTLSAARLRLPTSGDSAMDTYRGILEKYGEGRLKAGGFTLSGFSFAMPFAEALARAGRELTRERFIRALHTMKNYDGAGPHISGRSFSAPITFAPDKRLGTDRIYLMRAQSGRWVQVTGWLSAEPQEELKEK